MAQLALADKLASLPKSQRQTLYYHPSRAFAGYAKNGYAGSDVKTCEKLFKRMLRKVK